MNGTKISDVALLALRLGVGIIFVAHGFQKLFGLFGGSGLQGVAGMLKSMGFAPPLFWAVVLGLGETLGGIFLILGFLPRIGAALIAVVMLVAIAKVHLARGFFAAQGGLEYPFLILMSCLALIISGAGRLSFFNRF